MTTLQPNQLCDLVNYLLQMPPNRRIEVFVVKTWLRAKERTGVLRVEHWAEHELQSVGMIPRWNRNPRYPGRPITIPREIQRFCASRLPGFRSGGVFQAEVRR